LLLRIQQAQEAAITREARPAQQLQKIEQALAKAPHSDMSVLCQVQHVQTGSDLTPSNTTSLMNLNPNIRLTTWFVDEKLIHLDRLHRYVCLIKKTGKFGWVRVGQTRITFVERSVIRSEMITLSTQLCRLSFSALWGEDTSTRKNLQITVTPRQSENNGNVSIDVWFSLDDIEILDIRVNNATNSTLKLGEWIRNNQQNFIDKMVSLFLDSFTFEENLTGVQADLFFGAKGTYHSVRLYRFKKRPILVIEH
jgi:hypothetical protein